MSMQLDQQLREDRPMPTSQLTVNTLEVSVRVLRVGPKQCTVAMFQQIPEQPFDPETGVIWGWVNHHLLYPMDCRTIFPTDPAWSHRHFVWSDGTRLFRSIVQTRPLPSAMTVAQRDAKLAQLEATHRDETELSKRANFDYLAHQRKGGATKDYIRRTRNQQVIETNGRAEEHKQGIARVHADYQCDQVLLAKAEAARALWIQVDATGQLFVL